MRRILRRLMVVGNVGATMVGRVTEKAAQQRRIP